MTTIKFSNRISPNSQFRVLTKAPYASHVEPLAEIIDNSIAANPTKIHIDIDLDTNMGSIEDNGKGFPINAEELARCFTYGNNDKNTSEMNEHGCGLKSSLAVLDPTDKAWRIQWKNKGQVYRLKTSFTSDEHEVVVGGTWDGEMTDQSGVLIQFPIGKQGFTELYSSTKDLMNIKSDDLLNRIRIDFAHRWMLHPKILNRSIQMFLNGEYIEPFTISADVCDKTDKHNEKLISGADLYIATYMLNDSIKSSWFKKTKAASGFYVYKNGRYIQSFLEGNAYKRLYGSEPHPDHNGFICLVNVTGPQKICPPTIPTKNGLDTKHDITIDLFEKVNKNVLRVQNKKQVRSEESLFNELLERRRIQLRDFAPIIHVKTMLAIAEYGTKTPQLDGYEIIGNRGIIYEAKKANMPALDDINQLFANWIYSCLTKEFTGKTCKPVLVINAIKKNFKLSDDLKQKIKILNSTVKFPLEIWNYDGEELFKMD
jgi:hypothetical protein